MNPIEKLKSRFAASLVLKGVAVAFALLTTFSLVRLGVFLLIQDRLLERQLELRGESIAQLLANELQHPLLAGDRGETRRLLEAACGNEDVLFLEVLNPAG